MRNAPDCRSDLPTHCSTQPHTEDVEVVLARNELMSEIPFVNRFMVELQATLHLKRMLDQADLHITPSRLIMFSFMAGTLGSGYVGYDHVHTDDGVVWLIAASIPFIHVWWKRRKRFNEFLGLLPDALELVSRALSAGHAFSEALHMVSTEMPEPIASEFRKTYEEQNLGLSLKLALENLAQRIPLLDLRMCITAVLISAETVETWLRFWRRSLTQFASASEFWAISKLSQPAPACRRGCFVRCRYSSRLL